MADNEDRITKVVELAAPPARVWRALTDHEEFGTWFRVDLDGPFEVGAQVTGRMTYPGYEGVGWSALIESMEPERRFAFSWHPGNCELETDFSAEPTTLVEFLLEPTAGGTRLTITESGFSKLSDPRRLEALRSNRQGWDLQSQHIADHVAG